MLAGLFAARRNRTSLSSPSSHSNVRSNWFSVSPKWLPFSRQGGDIGVLDEHPIPKLMADAEQKFKALLAKQSKTLVQAVAEYKRRYGRDPPRGFDDWWEFATQNDVKLVDEYDAIFEDLGPFWLLSGREFRERAHEAGQLPSIDLVRILDGEAIDFKVQKKFKDQEKGHRSLGFRRLLEKYQHKLPNMDFPINAKAEGRVLVPWENQQYSNLTFESSVDEFTPDWQGAGSVWDAFRRTCAPNTQARRLFSSYRNPNIEKPRSLLGTSNTPGESFAFVSTVDVDLDFCRYPWAHVTQGHFFSDWRTMSKLYPVFSPAKAKGFADIRIPSHYYHGQNSRYTYGWDPVNLEPKEIDDMEVPWDEKSEVIFWRGATTGGGSTPPGFSPNYQRHRFVHMTHDDATANCTIIHESPLSPGTFISTTVLGGSLNREITDVAFVSSVGSYPGGEEALRKAHRFADAVPLGEHWSYKYLIDLDGMGYSGRFMAFMASDSAVIKSTVYKEYFSDWVQPWLHYIPLSSSYSEIYNIHAYFSGPTYSTLQAANMTGTLAADISTIRANGDRQLRQIARAGKQWKRTMGRTVDMEAYVYRLCLEYARLWADNRDTWSFTL
ncbi:glycosyltransferase family 90 protein [Scleroderma citrinum Foug A]|uniref:Glycosyltransferase family 90 protein n=1 Tax=Scleroderma citrinum Foug A TaxID=1036808 RepID=A0A0C2YWI3_9AGAM|nr:glycosyltransferase family 90 protein [Scleroderma citrinum Foug A]